MLEKNIRISILVYQFDELPKDYQKLISEAKAQTRKAYAPYSKFCVGASVLLTNGMIFGGNNQENIAYPSGLCAERVALFHANSQQPEVAVKAIAVAAYTNNKFTDKPITPCGACRQVLLETQNRFKQNIELLLYGEEEIFVIKDAGNLMPLSFSM
jgi:cytidine deaminase